MTQTQPIELTDTINGYNLHCKAIGDGGQFVEIMDAGGWYNLSEISGVRGLWHGWSPAEIAAGINGSLYREATDEEWQAGRAIASRVRYGWHDDEYAIDAQTAEPDTDLACETGALSGAMPADI
jgi:hypothetical protein